MPALYEGAQNSIHNDAPDKTFSQIETSRSTGQSAKQAVSAATSPIASGPSPTKTRPPPTSESSSQRSRRKIAWRGKACIIALPLESDRPGSGVHTYLTPQDVYASLQTWQHMGYNIAGFTLTNDFHSGESVRLSEGQTRPQFPDPKDLAEERRKSAFRVNLPNLDRWEAHVNQLKEEKLRALGVSSCEEDPITTRPASLPSMSRNTSSQSSNLPISPLPRFSQTPNILQAGAHLPAGFRPSREASPQSHLPKKSEVAHFPRYSVSMHTEEKFLFPNKHPPTATAISHQYLPGSHYDTSTALRTASSLTNETAQIFYPKADATIIPYHNANIHLNTNVDAMSLPRSNEHLLLPGSTLKPDQVSAHNSLYLEQNPSLHSNNTVAESNDPKPQTFNRNSVMNWQEGADKVKAYTIDDPNNFREDPRAQKSSGTATISTTASAPMIDEHQAGTTRLIEDAEPTKGVNQKGTIVDKVDNDLEVRSSVSSLSVQAPEFVAQSSNTKPPELFSFSGSVPVKPATSTRMRPTAPAFTPGNVDGHLSLSRKFNFLSSGPSYKASEELKQKVVKPNTRVERPTNNRLRKMSGNVVSSDIIKPTAKSRAVPIVNPNARHKVTEDETDHQEDELGRITQAKGRQKRMRRSNDDAEQIAQFASPDRLGTPTFDGGNSPTNVERLDMRGRDIAHAGNTHSMKTADAAHQLEQMINDLSTSEESLPKERGSIRSRSSDQITAAHESVDEAESEEVDRSFSSSIVQDFIVQPKIQTTTEGSIRSPSYESVDFNPEAKPVKRSMNIIGSTELQNKGHDLASLHTMKERRGQLKEQSSTLNAFASHNDSNSKASVLVPDEIRTFQSHVFAATPDLVGDAVSGTNQVGTQRMDNIANAERIKNVTSDRSSSVDGSCGHSNPQRIIVKNSDEHEGNTNKRQPRSHAPSPSPSPRRIHGGQRSLSGSYSESVSSSLVKMVAQNARFSPSFRPSKESTRDPSSPVSGSANSASISELDDALCSAEEGPSNHEQTTFDDQMNDSIDGVIQYRLEPIEKILETIQDYLQSHLGRDNSLTRWPTSLGDVDDSDADDEEELQMSKPRPTSLGKDSKYHRLHASLLEIATAQQHFAQASELSKLGEAVGDLRASLQASPPSSDAIKSIVEEAVARQMRGRSGPVTSSHQSAAVEKNQLQIAGLESMLKTAEIRAEDELKARRATEDALADNQRLLRIALQDAAEQRESAEETERSLSAFHEERHQALRHSAMLEGAHDGLQKTVYELGEKNTALEGTLEEYRLSSKQWREEIEDVNNRNYELQNAINTLKVEVEEGIRGRQTLRTRFDQLQESMTVASKDVLRDQLLWRSREERYQEQCKELQAKLELEIQIKESTELEVKEFNNLKQERLMILTELENTKKTNQKLEEQVENLRSEINRQCAITTRYELDLQNATQLSQEHDQLQKQEQMLLKSEHDYALKKVSEDKERIEEHCSARLTLADEKMLHYEDRIKHLEEKLEIAKSAAWAAAQAAQSRPAAASSSHASSSPSIPTGLAKVPEKVSPQALRESILVLQEQLQDRESRIEQLEQNISQIDSTAPLKLKDLQNENNWLRELLSVRSDDLEDVVSNLSQPAFDREAVKEAAIRLRTSLQMEQQEKERAITGGQSFPSIAGLSSLASSPRALPLAAAAAWGSWRRAREASPEKHSGLGNSSNSQTPSRISPSAHSFLSGLMTPPSTELRLTAPSNTGAKSDGLRSASERSRNVCITPRKKMSVHEAWEDQEGQSPVLTPLLMRKADYDEDAINAGRGTIADRSMEQDASAEDEPFGPSLTTFQGRT